jgi:hypothetical protein
MKLLTEAFGSDATAALCGFYLTGGAFFTRSKKPLLMMKRARSSRTKRAESGSDIGAAFLFSSRRAWLKDSANEIFDFLETVKI